MCVGEWVCLNCKSVLKTKKPSNCDCRFSRTQRHRLSLSLSLALWLGVCVCVNAWNVYVTKYYYVYVSFPSATWLLLLLLLCVLFSLHFSISFSTVLRLPPLTYFPSNSLLCCVKLCRNFPVPTFVHFSSISFQYSFQCKSRFLWKEASTRWARDFSVLSIVSIIFLAYTHSFRF